jgi:hypothetical protein
VITPIDNEGLGPLYHVGWYACRVSNGAIQYGGSGFYESFASGPGVPNYIVGYLYRWAPTQTRTLQPGCSNPLQWHVVAAWPNEPVVVINYVRH